MPSIQRFQLIVPKGYLDTAHAVLEVSGFLPQPLDDRDRSWEVLGSDVRSFVTTDPTTRPLFSRGFMPHKILLHDFGVGQSIFSMDDPSSYPQFGGISIPPLSILAQSYVRSAVSISEDRFIQESRSLLCVWFMYVRDLGYAPLGCDAGDDAAYLDDSMKRWWKGDTGDWAHD